MKYTTLVNKNNKIKDNYLNKCNLLSIKNELDEDILVEEKTYIAYIELKKYLEEFDIFVGIDDSYRSIEIQEELYNTYLKEKGQDYVDNYVAVPSYSEHHTGLAIDLMLKIDNEYIREDLDLLKYTDIFDKIHRSLSKYGFILRYPKDKEKITGYNYEPWHIRYVGELPAQIIYDNKLTLEEYLSDYGTVLYINKPIGITSFDVVNNISKLFGIKRVGHTGTLDPMARGVLIVTVGKACKIVDLLTSNDKEYIATFELGNLTDTYDNTGNIIDTKEVPSNINMKEVLDGFKKSYLQEVPIYSAVKVNGKKLYEYARNNIEVELPKKEVIIKDIELLEQNNNSYKIRCLVSKGTYIRSLINDIGLSLNTYATMTSLERTKQGVVSIEETNTLEDDLKLHSILEVLDYRKIVVEDELEKNISNGMKIIDNWNVTDKVIFIDKNSKLLAIYTKEDAYLKSFKNFV